MMEQEVLSEVHLECGQGCAVSCFTIASSSYGDGGAGCNGGAQGPEHQLETASAVDDDGDLVPPRRSRRDVALVRPSDSILIYHNMATVIPLVGLQVWRGALLLADFIIHKIKTSTAFENVIALEFGCGTGLAGIILARQAKLVFLTDKGDDVLDNCSRNVFANRDSFVGGESSVRVKELDWGQGWPPQNADVHRTGCYHWSQSDVKDAEDATVFLAADVVYSDDLTDALFGTVSEMFSRGSNKVLYLGLEKRHNFSMDALDVVANGYANFLTHLSVEGNNKNAALCGRRLDSSAIPKYIMEYDRGTELELWEICAAAPGR